MKINGKYLVILTDMNMGGVTTAAVNFCNGLNERGGQVDVLLMSDCQNAVQKQFDEGINIVHLRGRATLWNLGYSMIRNTRNPFKKVWLSLLGGVKRIVNRKNLWNQMIFRHTIYFEGYDAVMAYRQCPPCYYFALHCVDAKKRVAFVHGDIDYMGDISTWQKYMYEFDAVAYVSNAVKAGFIKRYPNLGKNAVTVYNTFNTEDILKKAQLPCACTFDRTILNIVTVSRVENATKGTGRIPPLCKLLKDRYGDKFHWYVVGDGPDMDICVEEANRLEVTDRLTFLGASNNPYPVFSQADICVFPTFTEAFPMVVGESLILGIPIVATRYPAVGEIIVDGQNGLIAEQSIESIFEKICLLFDNKDLLSQMKEYCVAYEYDSDRSFAQFMEAIKA